MRRGTRGVRMLKQTGEEGQGRAGLMAPKPRRWRLRRCRPQAGATFYVGARCNSASACCMTCSAINFTIKNKFTHVGALSSALSSALSPRACLPRSDKTLEKGDSSADDRHGARHDDWEVYYERGRRPKSWCYSRAYRRALYRRGKGGVRGASTRARRRWDCGGQVEVDTQCRGLRLSSVLFGAYFFDGALDFLKRHSGTVWGLGWLAGLLGGGSVRGSGNPLPPPYFMGGVQARPFLVSRSGNA